MQDAALSPKDWLDRAGAAWRWWLDQLAVFVPASLRQIFAAPPDAIFIDVHTSELMVVRRAAGFETVIARIPRDEFAVRALALSAPKRSGIGALLGDPVVLRLPTEEGLVRSLRLPKGARRDLEAILRHEVARQSPLGAQDIYYDYRAERGDDGLDVTLRIVRREPVDALLRDCQGAGIALAGIEFQGDVSSARGANFPVDEGEARRRRLAPMLMPALAGVVLLFAAGFAASHYLRGEAVAADLAGKVDAARSRAAVVIRLEHELSAANRQAAFLVQQKRNPMTTAVLATVARLLPDDAYLDEFELSGNEVRLHGYSSQAASLIQLFDSSPDFSGAQFRAPLVQGPSANLQRFDLSMKLGKSAT